MKIDFYYINKNYLNQLRQAEIENRGFTCVPNTEYHSGRTKFFYGAVMEVNSIKYFVPVSSKAHYKQDDMIIKVKDKQKPIMGTLRFRYMLPVPNDCIDLLIRDNLNDNANKERIRKELSFCRKNKDLIEKKATQTYNRVIDKSNTGLTDNSCDFKLLEEVYKKHIQNKQLLSDIIKLIKEKDLILDSNPSLKQIYKNAEELYNSKNNYSGKLAIDDKLPINEQLSQAYSISHRISEIIKSNPTLKAEYINARDTYREKLKTNECIKSIPPAKKLKL